MAGQDTFDQVIGPQEIDLRPQISQDGNCFGVGIAAAQGLPQVIFLAVVGQGEQHLLCPPEQRRFQRRRQRQAVFGRGKERQQRRQILHRQFGPDLQPVRARNRHTGGFARADDFREQITAPLHKDQKVTRPNTPPRKGTGGIGIDGQIMFALDQLLDLRRDLVGQNDRMVMCRLLIDRIGPFTVIGFIGFLDHGPKINTAGQGGFERLMRRIRLKPCIRMGGERCIHQLQDRRGRSERIFKTAPLKDLTRLGDLLFEQILFVIKLARVGPLKGIDRLFFIAHDKQRAVFLFSGTVAAVEFIGQPFDDIPLARAGILRFVHQNMINATVDPVKHPSRDRRVGQQRPRLEDQIIKVEPAAFLFLVGIDFKETMCELMQHMGLLRRPQRQPRVTGIFDPPHQVIDLRHQIKKQLLRRFRGQAADLGGKGFFGARTGQHHVFQNGQGGDIHCLDRRQLFRRFAVQPALGPHRRDHLFKDHRL